MSKSLSARIALRATDGKTTKKNLNWALFLSLREDIEQALADGWTRKSIWETLREEGKAPYSYDTFLAFLKRDITSTNPAKTGKQKTQPRSTPFSYNPTPNHNDLI